MVRAFCHCTRQNQARPRAAPRSGCGWQVSSWAGIRAQHRQDLEPPAMAPVALTFCPRPPAAGTSAGAFAFILQSHTSSSVARLLAAMRSRANEGLRTDPSSVAHCPQGQGYRISPSETPPPPQAVALTLLGGSPLQGSSCPEAAGALSCRAVWWAQLSKGTRTEELWLRSPSGREGRTESRPSPGPHSLAIASSTSASDRPQTSNATQRCGHWCRQPSR